MMKLERRRAVSMTGTSCAAIVVLGLAAAAHAATQYHYVATTKSAVADDETPVQAGSLTWTCEGNQCRISGPWPNPGVDACRALAHEVGPIASYGYKGRWLTSQQLATCNKGIQEAQLSIGEIQATKGMIKEDLSVRPQAGSEAIQDPAINAKLSEAKKAQANEDLRFLQARDRLREGNLVIDGGSVFVYLR